MSGQNPDAPGRIVRGTGPRTLAFTSARPRDSLPDTCTLHVVLYGVVFVLRASMTEDASSHGRYELSDLVLHTIERRKLERIRLTLSAATFSVTESAARVCHSRELRILDMTPDGLGLLLPEGFELPAQPFPAVLKLDEITVTCLAESTFTHVQAEGRIAGVRIRVEPGDTTLESFYQTACFPRLRPRKDYPARALSDLMFRSGYLALRDGEGVSESWRTVALEPALSMDFVYEASDETLLGHVSVTLAYSSTYMLHQLATLSGHPESAAGRAAIYSLVSSAPLLFGGEAVSTLCYFDRKRTWHQLFLEDFAHSVASEALATVALFDRFERPFDLPRKELTAPPGFSIGVAERDELLTATGFVRARLSPLVAHALDVSPWSLRSNELVRGAGAKLSRAREVLVLREGARICAVALCETGAAELSLFNLFNMAHVFVAECLPLTAELALLSTVRDFYARRGVLAPIVASPANTLRATAEEGTQLSMTMGCAVFRGEALRQWHNFCAFHFGRLYQRHS